MVTKETALKLEKELRYGDKRRIAKLAGFDPLTVIRFYNGEISKLSSETQEKVLTASLALLADRQKRSKALEKKTDMITGNGATV